MSNPSLPVIDIEPLLHMTDAGAAADTARRIGDAAEEFGFFYAVDHGIGSGVFADLLGASRTFFAQPEAEKARIAMAKGGIAWRGWFPVAGELTSGFPDLKEGLYLGEELGPNDPRVRAGLPLHGANLWPAAVPALRPAVEAYVAGATRAGEALMRGMALSLGLAADHFADGLTRHPTLLFRIFHYPGSNPDVEGFGVGEHSDYGLLTLLAQDDKGGLEVRTREGWIDVPPLGNALVINVGDMFERLTRGRFRSAPHRVVNRSGVSRYSFPLFFDPDFARRLTRYRSRVAKPREAARWDYVDLHATIGTYGDYLLGKVSRCFPSLRGRSSARG
ncbi:isopenicillin N synthase-like dioxygenase [Sphingopyxis panaciterrae]|uniref:isopenicillin N synthase family dioxygenase n=1 Tax=Sphingopyxis panaciterrae TaxID=363841 RepID=UPI00142235F6|nr:isopenicillin N synthase family oxygenase [Sphingopyxis panaciterrae]NIJ37490.1 isopenicillin N synthase-like dioxygenase [Sphingopyxis panaciterrae]